jgi:pimeloyl-ACP methyl ester carboxylesterase
MDRIDVLFLPSGPGLNAGPASVFLRELFSASGRAVFWNEPSAQRGEAVESDDRKCWDALVLSLVKAAESFPGRFAIVTESFGSILAEVLFTELQARGHEGRVAGILHTPPTLDLWGVFRSVMKIGEGDFRKSGDTDRLERMLALASRVDSDPRIGSNDLHAGVSLAFESPVIMTHYFRSLEMLGRWASGFGLPGCGPEPEMRDRILRGLGDAKIPLRTTFFPDVPTFVCAGGYDPYQPLSAFESVVDQARQVPGRKTAIVWKAFADTGHYPYADDFAAWESEAWRPFLKMIG